MKAITRFIFTLTVMLCAGLLCTSAQAEFYPEKYFVLSDGSTVKGKLVGTRTSDGAYIIESLKLGTIAVQPADVVTMTNEAVSASRPQAPQDQQVQQPSTFSPENIQQMQTELLADPSVSASVEALAADPQVMEILMDPELMKAISSMDPETIQSHPKIQKLLQNPKMRILMQQTAQKMMKTGTGTAP